MRVLRMAALAALGALGLGTSAALSEEPAPASAYFRSDRGRASGPPAPLPDRLDAAAQAWRTPLDPGHSSPVVAGNRIFLTTYSAKAGELATVALDLDGGKLLWRNAVKVEKPEATHPIGSPATATPACDGRRVFSFFGSRGLFCYTTQGARLWEQPLGPFQDEYGAGSSPILADGLVILNQDHDVGSFLAAFDAETGGLRWKTPRPDAVRSYSTPVVWTREGRRELIVAGALEIAGYDLESGRRRWWVNGLARIVIPTPVVAGPRIYVASWAPGGDAGRRLLLPDWPVAVSKWDANHDGKLSRTEIDDHEVLDRFFRIDLNQDGLLDEDEWRRHAAVFQKAQNVLLALEPKGEGDLTASAVVWRHAKGVPYVPSPVLTEGGLWMVKDGGIVSHLESGSGQLLQERRASGIGSYYASPVAGDGKVFVASQQGVITVLADEPEWRVISSREFHEEIFATPALHGGRLLLRTEEALYCFRQPPAN